MQALSWVAYTGPNCGAPCSVVLASRPRCLYRLPALPAPAAAPAVSPASLWRLRVGQLDAVPHACLLSVLWLPCRHPPATSARGGRAVSGRLLRKQGGRCGRLVAAARQQSMRSTSLSLGGAAGDRVPLWWRSTGWLFAPPSSPHPLHILLAALFFPRIAAFPPLFARCLPACRC